MPNCYRLYFINFCWIANGIGKFAKSSGRFFSHNSFETVTRKPKILNRIVPCFYLHSLFLFTLDVLLFW